MAIRAGRAETGGLMERRTFLKAAGLAAASGVAATASAQSSLKWQRTAKPADVVVIGAGAFGGWTALRLRETFGVDLDYVEQD